MRDYTRFCFSSLAGLLLFPLCLLLGFGVIAQQSSASISTTPADTPLADPEIKVTNLTQPDSAKKESLEWATG